MRVDRGHKGLWHPLLTLIDLYAALLVAYLLLRLMGAGQFWVMELVSVFVHWLLLLSLFLLPMAVLSRRWVSVGLLSAAGLAFLWIFGGLFLPVHVGGPDCEDDPSTTLRVMTYNISNGQASPENLVEVIRESGADVIALQELPSGQIPTLDEGIAEDYPYRIFHGEGFSGIGLLSQHPILREEVFRLDGPRPYLRADVAFKGRTLNVISAHPTVVIGPGFWDVPGREDMKILSRIAVEKENTILMGDFNFTDQHVHYQHLVRAGLIDAHRVAGWGFGLTYPRRGWREGWRFPFVRIDYIFLSGGLCPRRAWVGDNGGSDHLPVLATLSW